MADEVVVQFEGISKRYHSGDFWRPLQAQALTDVSFEVSKGEVFGLVGLNGSGKTTLMKTAVGLLRPDKGSVSLMGLKPSSVEARRRFGYLPELPYFPRYLTAMEVLKFYGGLHGLSGRKLDARVQAVLELVGIWKAAKNPIREYSKGMQQRVGLAQTLLHDPELLFLDEPLTGLDPKGMKEVRDVILLARDQGKTIFFNSHSLAEVERICDRVGLMVKGSMALVSGVGELVSSHQSSVTLGLHSREQSLLEKIKGLGLVMKEENQLWTLEVPNDRLAEILGKLAEMNVPTPSVLSYGSPLESAFLEKAGGGNDA